MTGWRLGYLTAPTHLVEVCTNLQSNVLTSASTFSQHAIARTMHLVETDVRDMVAEFKRRRDFVVSELHKLGFKCKTPQSAFYAWPEVPAPYDGSEIARKLLKEAFVATTPGEAFGPNSRRFTRISFGNVSYERTVEAFERISRLNLS